MTPTPARLKLLSGINEYLDRCERDRTSGELVVRIVLNQGGVRQTKIERTENLSTSKIELDKLEIFAITGK